MELIHIVRTRHVQSNQQSSSLEHERQIKKLSRLLKSNRVARTSHETLDCRLLGLEVGGANRDRTDDLLLAKQALSQLSYTPGRGSAWWAREDLNLRPHAYQARALTN